MNEPHSNPERSTGGNHEAPTKSRSDALDVRTLVNRLFTQKWTLIQSTTKSFDNGDQPGVYLLAYTEKDLDGQPIALEDIFYVGMSNSAGGINKRLRQFTYGLEKKKLHSGAKRFFR